MTRRTLASVLLLVASALSVAAVFAVHRIEARGGPLAEPWASPAFSPNGDGERDAARISFTAQQPERVTVSIRDAQGRVVRHLLRDARVEGRVRVSWDGADRHGRTMPDGSYRATITRAGDERTYGPVRDIDLDTRAPLARLDRGTIVGGTLGALVVAEPGTTVRATAPDGSELEPLRAFRPRDPDRPAARPRGPVPAGTQPLRVIVRVGSVTPRDLGLVAVDTAGNMTDLLAGGGRARIETAP